MEVVHGAVRSLTGHTLALPSHLVVNKVALSDFQDPSFCATSSKQKKNLFLYSVTSTHLNECLALKKVYLFFLFNSS